LPGKHHDLVDRTKRFKGELQWFSLGTDQWRSFKTRYKLKWEKARFDTASQATVPRERGVYVFTLEFAGAKLPPHSYVLYVGITGDTSGANLQRRYGQYLRNLRTEAGRPAVVYMMMNWREELYFNYVALPNKNSNLAKLERDLISSMMPPFNKRDIRATIGDAKAATF